MLSRLNRIALFCLMAGVISCCPKTEKPSLDTGAGSEALIEADCAFASLAADSGLAIAFASFAADSAVIFRDGANPFVGRDTIRQIYSRPSRGTLTWEPYFADIGGSNDLGYTLGRYQFTIPDSTGAPQMSHGYYVTIWKKQADGSWKYVLDTSVSGPAEAAKP